MRRSVQNSAAIVRVGHSSYPYRGPRYVLLSMEFLLKSAKYRQQQFTPLASFGVEELCFISLVRKRPRYVSQGCEPVCKYPNLLLPELNKTRSKLI
jgi:hypothetical protein